MLNENVRPKGVEQRLETEKQEPAVTIYLLRHGESAIDKTDPKRGLTETGRNQVNESFTKIIDNTIREELPEFNEWDNPEARKEAAKQAFSKVEIHLRDSGTDRTLEQVWQEYEQLRELGIENIILPKPAYEWKEQEPTKESGPGIAGRLKGIQGLSQHPEFRKILDSKEYQDSLGTADTMIAWALTPEESFPEGVENKRQMAERLKKDLAAVERVIASPRFNKRRENPPQRIIVIANSHSSIITLGASVELGIPIEQLGEVGNAEGLRFDFYGDNKHTTQPFGKNIEQKVQKS